MSEDDHGNLFHVDKFLLKDCDINLTDELMKKACATINNYNEKTVEQKLILNLQQQNTELLARVEELESLMVRLYNTGYGIGHNDTVEGIYTDIHHSDMDTYHSDVVGEWIDDNSEYNKSPQQSLAEHDKNVKARAILDAIKTNHKHFACDVYRGSQVILVADLVKCAKGLKQGGDQ